MLRHVPITIVSDDKPGLVEIVARCINEHEGNWLESNLAKLSGKFAGVVLIELPKANYDTLKSALLGLRDKGIYAYLHDAGATQGASTALKTLSFKAAGPDQKGIVKELTELFRVHGVNVQRLSSQRTSMPYSGEPLFEASGVVELPQAIQQDEFEAKLKSIGDRLALDIMLMNNEPN